MPCGVMGTGSNQGDWERLLQEDYSRPPTIADAANLEWNNPGFAGIPGYEDYRKRQTAAVGGAEAGFAARRATQPIGTPDEILDKIKLLQQALSLERLVVHVFYGGMARYKAAQSLRLCAEKVLPIVQAMPTPINLASLGETGRCAG